MVQGNEFSTLMVCLSSFFISFLSHVHTLNKSVHLHYRESSFLMSKRVVLRKPKRFLWKLLRSSKNLLFLNINKILSFKNLLDRAYFWFLASHVPNSKYTFAYGRNLFFIFCAFERKIFMNMYSKNLGNLFYANYWHFLLF